MKPAEEVCVRGEEGRRIKEIKILVTDIKMWLHNIFIYTKGIA